jgi:integrase
MKSTSKKRTPSIVNLTVKRRYLTQREVERLMDCARKHGRYGHRDATMILVAYRHGLRASEVCDLQWQQIELSEGRLHVHRVKNGIASVHPIRAEPPSPPRQKKERSGLQSACDELIDKGAIHHRRIVSCIRPELGEFIQ